MKTRHTCGSGAADPAGTLSALCAALELPFFHEMLSWPAGRRDSDGVWAPVWYDRVERSSGFGPPRPEAALADLPARLRPIAEAARPHFERMAAFKLTSSRAAANEDKET